MRDYPQGAVGFSLNELFRKASQWGRVRKLTPPEATAFAVRDRPTTMTEKNSTPHVLRTQAPVAGEAIKDPLRWPGYVMLAVALFAFAGALTGFATGNRGAGSGALALSVLLVAAGLLWHLVERRKVRRGRLSRGTPERPEDIAPLA